MRYDTDRPFRTSRDIRARAVMAAATATVALGALVGCSSPAPSAPTVTATATTTVTVTPPPVVVTATPAPETSAPPVDTHARPLWLGANPLAIDPDTELGVRAPTPEELRDRQLSPRTFLPDPESDDWVATISEVPRDVLERSTWAADCPVALKDLSYIAMPYWGFDQRAHQGEMLIHRDVAADVVSAFKKIYEARFPIEEMRVINLSERDSPPTGDQNVTSGFTCRTIVGTSTLWSEHSKGYAIDINPFHNPYIRDDALFPELSEAYLDRGDERPGMIGEPGVVFDAFEAIGWGWGGHWKTHDDWMHFSSTGG